MRIHVDGPGDIRQTSIGDCQITGVDVIRYASGKIFVKYLYSGLLDKLSEDLQKNIAADYDNIVVIEGREGSGKSNLAYQICKSFDPDFDLTRQYIYSVDEFLQNLGNDDQKTVYWLDETSNVANNRDWQTQHNKDFIQLLEMMRSRHWTLIMCIPHTERLDVYIRESRIKYQCVCYPMTFNDVHKKRGYSELKKVPELSSELKTVGFGEYNPIPPEVKTIYEQIKLGSQNKKIDEIKNRKKPGEKYKSKYEEKCKEENAAMLWLSDLGVEDDELMTAFSINARSTFLNRLSKARRERDE